MPIQKAYLALLVSLSLCYLLSFRKRIKYCGDKWSQREICGLGGIGIFVGVFLFSNDSLVLWGGLLFSLGLIDDIFDLKAKTKLFCQVLIVMFFIPSFRLDWFGNRFVDLAITFVWLLLITNSFNLLDNMDGLAGGIAVIILVFFLYTTSSALGFVLLGAIFGFFFLNFPPARIYMGDSGSLFTGFMLAALVGHKNGLSFSILLFLVPLTDTVFVIVRRFLDGKSIFKGGTDHLSHTLVKQFGFTEREAILILYLLSLSGVMGVLI